MAAERLRQHRNRRMEPVRAVRGSVLCKSEEETDFERVRWLERQSRKARRFFSHSQVLPGGLKPRLTLNQRPLCHFSGILLGMRSIRVHCREKAYLTDIPAQFGFSTLTLLNRCLIGSKIEIRKKRSTKEFAAAFLWTTEKLKARRVRKYRREVPREKSSLSWPCSSAVGAERPL